MSYSVFKLDRHELGVTDIAIQSPQRVTWIEIPAGRDVNQDWGPGPKVFLVRGHIFRREGGLGLATEIDALKDRRETVVFRLDENSWEVQCQDFNWRPTRGGGCDFDLELREVRPPETYVFLPQPELEAASVSRTYLLLVRAQSAAFRFRGLADRFAEWVNDAETRLLELADLLEDVVRLAELPWATVAAIKGACDVVVSRMDSVLEMVNDIFDTETRRYSDNEESLKLALLYAREVRTRIARLRAACNSVPRAEQRHIVTGQDTLVSIAAQWNADRGTDIHWSEIMRANGLNSPDELVVGQELVIPG